MRGQPWLATLNKLMQGRRRAFRNLRLESNYRTRHEVCDQVFHGVQLAPYTRGAHDLRDPTFLHEWRQSADRVHICRT